MKRTTLLGTLTFCGFATLVCCDFENRPRTFDDTFVDTRACPIGTFRPVELSGCVFPSNDPFGGRLNVSDDRCAAGQAAVPPVCANDRTGRNYFLLINDCAPGHRLEHAGCQRGVAGTGPAGTGAAGTGPAGTGAVDEPRSPAADNCPLGTFLLPELATCVLPANDQSGGWLNVTDDRCLDQIAAPPACVRHQGGRSYLTLADRCLPGYRFAPGACQPIFSTGAAGTGPAGAPLTTGFAGATGD